MRIRNLEALAGGGVHDPAAPACADASVATLDRRSFLKLTALAGGGFALGVAPMLAGAQDAA
ncbi:twin-arginine translocation signal domain-containing protein, partial [Ralstonia pseudosolanacearum]